MANAYTSVRESRGIVSGGILAGILAGCCFALLGMIVSYATGNGFWSWLQMFAGLFYGVNALVDGWASGVVGAVGLLVVSAIYGILFASLVRRATSPGAALWGGLVYGVCVWIFRTYVTLPLINGMMNDRVALSAGWWFVENLFFGAMVATTPSFKAHYAAREPRRTERPVEPAHR